MFVFNLYILEQHFYSQSVTMTIKLGSQSTLMQLPGPGRDNPGDVTVEVSRHIISERLSL